MINRVRKHYYDGISNDVTPSAIYIGRRGTRDYGYRAYERAAYDYENTAMLFKRYMGTSNKFDFKNAGLSLSPEECSAEIIRRLFGYLPDEIRNDPETATVITVPAAFNQVKKNATLEAANMAGLGRVKLMQEPVAAVMSVMRASPRNSSGIFLIYDLGGGTFDVSIAESTSGKVNLLTQDGKEMCGGRDWDRRIFDNIVVPWLKKNFALPDNFLADENYRSLHRTALYAIERAKIELSSKTPSEETIIHSDDNFSCKDLNGEEIYLEVPVTCSMINPLIDDILDETIDITRAAMKKVGLSASDIEKLVFIGGPTNYGYLREKVSAELAIKYDNSINPMTAVAEGASIFAESVDWSSEEKTQRPGTSDMAIGTSLYFHYESRTPTDKARVVCRVKTPAKLMLQISDDNTGWVSEMHELKDGIQLELPLVKNGDNVFSASVYDKNGRKIPVPVPKIIITKTLASVGAVPASHSIAVTALDKLGGTERLVYLIRKDESLPKKDRVTFKAAQTIKAGTNESLNFNLWEGEIESPYDDNKFIGVYKISGADLAGSDIIPAGSEIICSYEMSDGGTLSMSASVPCIGTEFERRNFYFHDEAKIDLNDTASLADDGRNVITRINNISQRIDDSRLDKAREKAEKAASIDSRYINGEEEVQEAYSELYEARKILSQVSREHVREINQMELDECTDFFNNDISKYADASETASINNLIRTAQKYVNDSGFEKYMRELNTKIYSILLRQDWFIIEDFRHRINNPNDYRDRRKFEELKKLGLMCIEKNKIDELRTVVVELVRIMKRPQSDDNRLGVNIIRG